jgi:hypothetical protein
VTHFTTILLVIFSLAAQRKSFSSSPPSCRKLYRRTLYCCFVQQCCRTIFKAFFLEFLLPSGFFYIYNHTLNVYPLKFLLGGGKCCDLIFSGVFCLLSNLSCSFSGQSESVLYSYPICIWLIIGLMNYSVRFPVMSGSSSRCRWKV